MSGVSVVVPVRGPAPFLAEALASLAADLSAAAEVIVVEDGTRAADEAALGGARLLRLPYVGRSRARNAGVEAASAPLVAFLDADDVSLPGRLARQRELLETVQEAALCFGLVRPIDSRSQPLEADARLERERFERLLGRGPGYESLLVDCPIYTSATMVRREAFLAAGGYDPALDAYEDLDLYLRLARRDGLVALLGDPVACHRRHSANTRSSELHAGALRVAEKHLPGASGRARRLLLERRVDSLWGLGDFAGARRAARAALRAEPRLVGNRRFAKRLAASALPDPALRAIRARRS